MRHHTRRSLILLRLLLPICWKIWPVAAKVVFLITVGCSMEAWPKASHNKAPQTPWTTTHSSVVSGPAAVCTPHSAQPSVTYGLAQGPQDSGGYRVQEEWAWLDIS